VRSQRRHSAIIAALGASRTITHRALGFLIGLSVLFGAASARGAVRPSYNTGVGFFVLNGKLYDANGTEFRVRGMNKLHWDNSAGGLANTHANTIRWAIDFTRDPNSNLALLRGGAGQPAGSIYNQMVVMPGAWSAPAGTLTCSSDPSILASAVSVWVAQAATWTQIERYSIINIANEWGPGSSIQTGSWVPGPDTVWRDSYITAIARLRAAGYKQTISVTSGGCGQDPNNLVSYAQAVFDSDPQKNVIFDLHVYGVYYDAAGDPSPYHGNQPELQTYVNRLKATGLVFIIGEFGPGRNIGPSPTLIHPERVIQIAEQAGFGWLAWAWDDVDLPNSKADDNWFALSYSGTYSSSADLTIFGKAVVETSTWGLKAQARPASIFSTQAIVPAAPLVALALLALALLIIGAAGFGRDGGR
jgi:mannan endo-1,4-beta-mannosidase